MNTKSVIITILVVVVLGVGGFFIFHKSDNKTPASTTTNSQPAATTTTDNSTSSSDQNAASTITYSDSGFSPATLTVKANTPVTIKNTSSSDMQFDSDPHPTHTDDPEINIGAVPAGKSVTFTPTVTGSHGYHNHLDPTQTGTLVVQ